MTEKHIYIADDGKEFANQYACEIYEAMLCNKKNKRRTGRIAEYKEGDVNYFGIL